MSPHRMHRWRLEPAMIQSALEGAKFPAGRDDLVSHALKSGAPDTEEVVSALEQTPERQYADMADLAKELEEAYSEEGPPPQ